MMNQTVIQDQEIFNELFNLFKTNPSPHVGLFLMKTPIGTEKGNSFHSATPILVTY